MITRATIVRSVLFVVLTIGLVLYVGAQFLGLFNFLGEPAYTVRMPLQETNGLFERSEVTYRGVKVGTIGNLELTDDGVTVALRLEGGGPPIPADLRAQVANRSAVGERYIDLLPNTDRPPYLSDGDVIPADRVDVPVKVETVLANLDKLVGSVPLDDLRIAVDELGKGFSNLGPKLQLLLDSTNALVTTANRTLPETVALIRDARTVLATQNDLAGPIKSFSSDLRLIAEQLRESDPDLRRLLETGPDAGRELSALIDESGDDLGDTIQEAETTSQILKDHLRDLQSVFQLYAGLAAAIPTIIPDDGTQRARLGLVLNIGDPPLCEKGYERNVDQDPEDVSPPEPIFHRAYCREPIFSPTNVRGIKPQYPFVNGKPQRPPDWFFAFYQGGVQEGIFGPSEDFDRDRGRTRDGVSRNPRPDPTTNYASMPGLLSAPATYGQFGLVPSVLERG